MHYRNQYDFGLLYFPACVRFLCLIGSIPVRSPVLRFVKSANQHSLIQLLCENWNRIGVLRTYRFF